MRLVILLLTSSLFAQEIVEDKSTDKQIEELKQDLINLLAVQNQVLQLQVALSAKSIKYGCALGSDMQWKCTKKVAPPNDKH